MAYPWNWDRHHDGSDIHHHVGDVRMKCIICETTGSSNPHTISLQSTPSGLVCSRCIAHLVADLVKMRKPWTEEDLIEWGYTHILDAKEKAEEE